MKWPVLGVLAVFLAQSGVIALTSLGRETNAVVAANGVAAGNDAIENAPFTPSEPDVSSIISDGSLGEYKTSGTAQASPARSYGDRSVSASFLTTRRVPKVAPSTAALFKPQVIMVRSAPRIEHPRVILTGFDKTETLAMVKPVRKTEKRSVASKSVSVIKKPYDWLKTLASRMM